MVNVPNGRVAIRRPAGVVPGFDQSPEPASKEPGLGVRGKEFSRARRCVEPAKPDGELRIRNASCPGLLGSRAVSR